MDKTSNNEHITDKDNNMVHNTFKHCYIRNIILTKIIVVVIISSSCSRIIIFSTVDSRYLELAYLE